VRRAGGYVLFVLGFVLIFMAPLLRWYVVPRVEKAPTDVYSKIVSDGFGRYFSVKLLSITNTRPLQNIQIYKGNPAASTKDDIVVSAFSRLYDTSDSTNLSYSQETYVFDRNTGVAVHCCGENPRHEGETLKFPFGTKKVTYPLYDDMAQKAFPAPYVRTEALGGLQTYVFESHVPDTFVGNMENVPGSLVNQPDTPSVTAPKHYMADTTVWIEPTTGAVIKGQRRAIQWLTDNNGQFGSMLADVNVEYNPATVQSNVDQYSKKAKQLRMVSTSVPIFGPIAGAIMIVVGLLLLRTPTRGRTKPAAEPAMAAG